MIGLKFTMTDGTVDHYDPVDIDNDFIEHGDCYQFSVGGYEWVVMKSGVSKFEKYQLCSVCGYELTTVGCSGNCPF